MVWKHLPQNRWFNQHLMCSFTSLTAIKKWHSVDFLCGDRLWSWRPVYNAEKPMAYQRDGAEASVVSWKSSQSRVALCLEYAEGRSWNRHLAEYLNSGLATPQSREKFCPRKVNVKFSYTKFCDFTMELSMLYPQWKCGIPTTDEISGIGKKSFSIKQKHW